MITMGAKTQEVKMANENIPSSSVPTPTMVRTDVESWKRLARLAACRLQEAAQSMPHPSNISPSGKSPNPKLAMSFVDIVPNHQLKQVIKLTIGANSPTTTKSAIQPMNI